jgi:hypothetical protein
VIDSPSSRKSPTARFFEQGHQPVSLGSIPAVMTAVSAS